MTLSLFELASLDEVVEEVGVVSSSMSFASVSIVARLVALVSMMVAPWREALPILVNRSGGLLEMKPMLMAFWMLM